MPMRSLRVNRLCQAGEWVGADLNRLRLAIVPHSEDNK
jgi:hypothetical protein